MENLKNYRQMLEEAEASVDYWLAGPVTDFTEDLCRLMKENDVTRAELARRIGSSRAYITKLLRGNANFTLTTMVKLAMAVGGAIHIHVSDQRAVTRWHDEVRGRKPKAGDSPKVRRARQQATEKSRVEARES
ncbi:MAG: helix-turn-helix transcriptional regulator [Thermoanaerobaculia bacterium]